MTNNTNTSANPAWKPLNVAVVGGGLGGMAAAVALRRAGHKGGFLSHGTSDLQYTSTNAVTSRSKLVPPSLVRPTVAR